MRHNITLGGFSYRLRPAVLSDSPFIVELRTNPDLSKYIHRISTRIEDQENWFRDYETREGDYYFIIENRNGEPEGTIGLYDVDDNNRTGEWGRWVLLPNSKAATESAWLLYRVVFERLKLENVYCRTIADNAKTVSFHDSSGLVRRSELTNHFELNGNSYTAIEHYLSREKWPETNESLRYLSERLAKLLLRKG